MIFFHPKDFTFVCPTEIVEFARQEVLRLLDAFQTDELCPCNRSVGGETLAAA